MVFPLLVLQGTSEQLSVGKDVYVKGPSYQLSRYASDLKFSRDGAYVLYIDERYEPSWSAIRNNLAKGIEGKPTALVRFDISRGTKEVLYVPTGREALMSIETVGPSGDVIYTIAGGQAGNNELKWKCAFSPIGGKTTTIVDQATARSFQIATSKKERKAFLFIAGPSGDSRYFLISQTGSTSNTLPVSGYQGVFGFRTKNGNPVVGLQGPPPEYRILGQFELDYRTGQAIPVQPTGETEEEEAEATPLIFHQEFLRPEGTRLTGAVPLKDIVSKASGTPESEPGTLFCQGTLGVLESSPSGLGVVFMTTEGVFFKEWIRLEKPRTNTKVGS